MEIGPTTFKRLCYLACVILCGCGSDNNSLSQVYPDAPVVNPRRVVEPQQTQVLDLGPDRVLPRTLEALDPQPEFPYKVGGWPVTTSDLFINQEQISPTSFNPHKGERPIVNCFIGNSNPSAYSYLACYAEFVHEKSGKSYLSTNINSVQIPAAGGSVQFEWEPKASLGGVPTYPPVGRYRLHLQPVGRLNTLANANGNSKQLFFYLTTELPKTDLIEFSSALPIKNDDGTNYPQHNVYFKAAESSVPEIKHPVVIPLSTQTPEPPSANRAQSNALTQTIPVKIRWKFDAPMQLPTEFVWRLRGPNGTEFMLPKRELIPAGATTAILQADMEVPREVQKIDFLKLDYKMLDVHEEWQTDIHVPEQPIFLTVGPPTGPLVNARNGLGPTVGLLDIACFLAKGATTADEATELIVTRLPTFFQQKEFVYNPEIFHTELYPFAAEGGWVVNGVSNTVWGTDDEHLATHQVFHYGLFMQGYNDQNLPWTGDCEDVSALVVVCGAAVGSDMNVQRCRGAYNATMGQQKPFFTNSIKPTSWMFNPGPLGFNLPCTFQEMEFSMHQVCSKDGNVWDPTFFFVPSAPVLIKNEAANTYWDSFLIKPGEATTKFTPIPILEVTWQ